MFERNENKNPNNIQKHEYKREKNTESKDQGKEKYVANYYRL